METLLSEPLYLLLVTFVLGICFGSFINVLIYRIPLMMFRDWHQQCHEFLQEHPTPPTIDAQFSIAKPASHCPQCQQVIKPWQNIPLISFILLRGKCGYCHTRLPRRYPLVELLSALLALIVVFHCGATWLTLAFCVFTGYLITLTFIDYEYQLLPDQLTLSLLWLGLLLNACDLITTSQSAILGALMGYLSLWLIGWGFQKFTGKEGMGYGDYKLFAAIGAWLGLKSLLPVILLASVTGIIITLLLMLCRKHQHQQPLPFGPYLAIAAWVYLLWGTQLQQLYWSIAT
jgi:leader peptidase (prepilin peptidase) / N-methyltransferase